MNDPNKFPMHVNIVVSSMSQLASVYALLGGVANVPAASGNAPVAVKSDTAPVSEASAMPESPTSDGTGPIATTDASPSDGELDAGGWPWNEEMHASTKTKTKEGYWRMKVGVSRPEPKPGFPVGEASPPTGISSAGPVPEASASAFAPTPVVTVQDGEDDEFAAFRAAAAKSDAEDAAAKASAPARKWTDADLGALCNQAAVKLGDPAPVKTIISEFVPAGEVAHSRNIPEADRDAFARAIEQKAGIEFAG